MGRWRSDVSQAEALVFLRKFDVWRNRYWYAQQYRVTEEGLYA
jgi:hypothetical protein